PPVLRDVPHPASAPGPPRSPPSNSPQKRPRGLVPRSCPETLLLPRSLSPRRLQRRLDPRPLPADRLPRAGARRVIDQLPEVQHPVDSPKRESPHAHRRTPHLVAPINDLDDLQRSPVSRPQELRLQIPV